MAYKRVCNHCGTEIVHKTKSYRDKAVKADRKCKACCRLPLHKVLFNRFKTSSKRRGFNFELTAEFIHGLLVGQRYECFYSMEPLDRENASIDRVDSSQPYVKNNVVICTKLVNMTKNKYEVNDYVNMCEQISYVKKFRESARSARSMEDAI